jgi:Subtilisin inhibitor-like
MGVCLTLMTACGPLNGSSDSDSGSGTSTLAAGTNLVVTVWPQGQGRSRRWTLTCDPAGGSLPRPRAACSRLTRAALRPLPLDTICTQIYGGPQRARVTGRIDGEPIDARFSRSNGCEIHRWDSVRYLFPVRI